MKLRVVALGLASALTLAGQHRFSWQDACFKNPGLPYCPGHEFAVKHKRNEKNDAPGGVAKASAANPADEAATPSVVKVNGIDWRFADPDADAIAALDLTQIRGPLARTIVNRFAAAQGLNETDTTRLFEALLSVQSIAVSVRSNRVLMMVGRRASDSHTPTMPPGWKTAPVLGGGMLIGLAEDVDAAARRIAEQVRLGELASLAEERDAEGEFWAAGSGSLAGEAATRAGVKRFWLTVSMRDTLGAELVYELGHPAESAGPQNWPPTFGHPTVDGNLVRSAISIEPEELRDRFGEIAGSVIGQRFGALVAAARYVPAPEAVTKDRSRPVIYGLDDGPRELGQVPQR